MTLTRAEVRELLATLDRFDVDSFELIRDARSGIGYTLDIEYSTQLNDTMVTIRVPVVGVDTW
jgi:hypothetical protein